MRKKPTDNYILIIITVLLLHRDFFTLQWYTTPKYFAFNLAKYI